MQALDGPVTDISEQVWARNNYYRDGFRILVRVVNIQAIIILAMTAFFYFYVKTAKNEDQFFAEALEGKKMQMVGLDLPNMGKTAVENWVSQAVTQIMTFGFNDIDERFAFSRENFTPDGWTHFQKAMAGSSLITNVIKSQQIITTVLKAPPVLLQEGIINGKYSWVFELQILMTFRAGSVQQASAKTVRAVVEQVPTSANPNAVGIGEWYIY